jgi:hypothetical protein
VAAVACVGGGTAAVVVGCYLAWPPLGWCLAGALLIAYGLLFLDVGGRRA